MMSLNEGIETMKITIVIPVYNGAEYLDSCIKSCVSQSYKDIEILLINDGSTDASEDIIESYEKKDSRVRHITQSNQGLVRSRKNGVKNTNTEFFVFLDADDILELTAIEKLVAEQKKTQSDIVFANFMTEFANGSCLAYSNNAFYNNYEASVVMSNILKKNIAPTIWGKLISKSLFMRINVPDYITIGEDAMAISQLLYLNPRISAIEENIYHYIQRDGSMVNTTNKHKNHKRLVFMKEYKDMILNQYGQSSEMEQNLKHFLIVEVFDVLRDGGSFKEVKSMYDWIVSTDDLSFYKSTIGTSRLLLIRSFVANEVLGKWVSYGYNRLRMVRNKLFPKIHG